MFSKAGLSFLQELSPIERCCKKKNNPIVYYGKNQEFSF